MNKHERALDELRSEIDVLEADHTEALKAIKTLRASLKESQATVREQARRLNAAKAAVISSVIAQRQEAGK